MPLEIEEKLQVNSSAVFDRIREEGRVAGRAMSRGRQALQRDTYFDTPGGRLYRTGASLRLREKDGRFVLTMKTPVEGARVRTEDEVFLTVDEAQHGLRGSFHLIDGDVAAAAVDYAEGASLASILVVSNQRETWSVSSPRGSLQMCFDSVEYSASTADGRTAHEYELELELRQGPRSFVVDAANRLAQRFGLTPQTRSKYERGVMLLGVFDDDAAVAQRSNRLVVPRPLLAV